MTPTEFSSALAEKLKTFDKKGAAAICSELIKHLYQSDEPFEPKIAERIMQQLRNKRMFKEMQEVGSAMILTGRHTFKIRRQYAQSLIDSGNYTAALSILNALNSDTKNAPTENSAAKKEGIEAQGLIGRLYKQLYVNAGNPKNPQNVEFLKEAIQAYFSVYTTSPKEYLWHGINVVALLHRAEMDQVELSGFPLYSAIAQDILTTIEDKHDDKKAETYDFATAAEASLALNKPKKAEEWTAYYASDPGCDAFELGSTLRQYEEVWRLDITSEAGKLVLPILRTELLKREGGTVVLQASEVKEQNRQGFQFEKKFGDSIFIDYATYKKGAFCCDSVARIGKKKKVGDGTGFLLKGSVLHEKLADEIVLLTNSHVVSEDPEVIRRLKCLRPEEAIIFFEALDPDVEFRTGKIFWSSTPWELDCTIIQFKPEDKDRLEKLIKNVNLYELCSILPIADSSERVYAIGYPEGGTLQYSLEDNVLLDIESPKIHYRTPTEGGSSGSPIFNQQWELIGIHHGGSKSLAKLNGKEGTYEANEGISISAIISNLKAAIA